MAIESEKRERRSSNLVNIAQTKTTRVAMIFQGTQLPDWLACILSLTGIAIYLVQLLRDRRNGDPSTRLDRDIPVPGPEPLSKQANHASANPYGTSKSLWVSEAWFFLSLPLFFLKRNVDLMSAYDIEPEKVVDVYDATLVTSMTASSYSVRGRLGICANVVVKNFLTFLLKVP